MVNDFRSLCSCLPADGAGARLSRWAGLARILVMLGALLYLVAGF